MSRRVPRAAAFAVAKVTTGGHVRCCSNRAVQRQLMASGHRTPQGRLGRQQRSVDQQCCILLARWCLSSQCLSRRSGCCTAATAASQATTREAAAIQLTQMLSAHSVLSAMQTLRQHIGLPCPPRRPQLCRSATLSSTRPAARPCHPRRQPQSGSVMRSKAGCHALRPVCGHVSWVLFEDE